ncbi:RNA polymerase subunit AC19 [Basidiobolus ranarum]|uniref:RNA polymerase subunit AC19 n=1 Tax=Basidiobolus ranarum TaxID=34480 RepID=A0ABR2VNP7_9FUNG
MSIKEETAHINSEEMDTDSIQNSGEEVEEELESENEGEVEAQEEIENDKIEIIAGSSVDLTAATFCLKDEDHTLGNALRYVIMKNPDVNYCGYTIPHPSEAKLNIRIQTDDDTTAVDALQKGLDDLTDMCQHILDTFQGELDKGEFTYEEKPNW